MIVSLSRYMYMYYYNIYCISSDFFDLPDMTEGHIDSSKLHYFPFVIQLIVLLLYNII